MIPIKNIIKNLLIPLALLVTVFWPASVFALPTGTYASSSVLSEGNWVKISVRESGIHLLSNSELKRMGFTDPSKVNIYGYGAMRLPDRLDGSYIDDLPLVQSLVTSRGIVFYAIGPESWTVGTDGFRRHSLNPFTTEGYYFISDRPIDRRTPITETAAAASEPVNIFTEAVYHEKDIVSLGYTGHALTGEDFINTPSRNFQFDLPGRVEDTQVSFECSFFAKSTTTAGPTLLSFTVNGTDITNSSSDRINPDDDSYVHYLEGRIRKQFPLTGEKLSVGITVKNNKAIRAANLNYIVVNYTRRLEFSGNPVKFTSSAQTLSISDATPSILVWDVTDPLAIHQMELHPDGNTAVWTNTISGKRDYMVFDPDKQLPQPSFAGSVRNQDIHASEVPDMVIFSHNRWLSQANRLADFHRQSADSLRVLVINQTDVFNEFSSGSPDPNAFRKLLKMFYDRSTSGRHLQYALFMGRGIYDNRQLTSAVQALNYPLMPIWSTDTGTSDNDSFSTDDIYAFLEDNSGTNLAADHYCIAVGRLPVTSESEARTVVDKIIGYSTSMQQSGWRNKVLLIADDDDRSTHMSQAENFHNAMLNSSGGSDIFYQKLYTDAYTLVGGAYPQAAADMNKALNEGVAWWTFIGHAGTTGWTGEKLLTYTDVNNLYLRNYPIVYAATCDFLRWDSHEVSAAEIMMLLKNGGCIAAISATRPVYISLNEYMTNAMGRNMFVRRPDGNRRTIGQIYQNAKNDFGYPDENKLRYVLMADPAMYPVVPHNTIVVTSINGSDPVSDTQPVMKAREIASVEGYVADHNGNILNDFNGTVLSALYDAERSVTTNGNGTKGEPYTFQTNDSRIFVGNDSVVSGRFSISVAMPSAISGNYRPAALDLYASENKTDSPRDAATVCRNLFVFGEDNSLVDTVPPVIEKLYLNHPTFVDGGFVNSTPMLVAQVYDNIGLNLSKSGLGNQITVLIDGKDSYADVADYFVPDGEGAASGTIRYPLKYLTDGAHTLRLRVWDTSGNVTDSEISFSVSQEIAPTVFDVYSDANPASVSANFYLSHDRPDAMVEVTVTVYNLMGQRVWSSTSSGRSDMYLSSPLTWNLTDFSGRRVGRGIYLYRASVKADGYESPTLTHRIAVTAPR